MQREMQMKDVLLRKTLIPSSIKRGTNFILHLHSEYRQKLSLTGKMLVLLVEYEPIRKSVGFSS